MLPSEARATLMNIVRIPLNLMVVSVLLNIDGFTETFQFVICGVLLCGGLYAALFLYLSSIPLTSSLAIPSTKLDSPSSSSGGGSKRAAVVDSPSKNLRKRKSVSNGTVAALPSPASPVRITRSKTKQL